MRGAFGLISTIRMRSGSAAACMLGDRRTRVQREAHAPVGVGGSGDRHDPGVETLESGMKRRKSAGMNSTGLPSRQEPLGGPEEAAQVAHAGLGEHRVEVEQQRAEDGQVLAVVAVAEGVEERRGLTGAERDAERVDGAEQLGCLGGRDPSVPGRLMARA